MKSIETNSVDEFAWDIVAQRYPDGGAAANQFFESIKPIIERRMSFQADQSVVPPWLQTLSYQQQSVLLLATRGPDGLRKHHPVKDIQRCYRATMLRAAMRQRFIHVGEGADSFMGLAGFDNDYWWQTTVKMFFHHVDEMPHHYAAHVAHGAQIIGYKHPDPLFRERWGYFYRQWCEDLHVNTETELEMDQRLSDWDTAKERLAKRGIAHGVEAVFMPKPIVQPVASNEHRNDETEHGVCLVDHNKSAFSGGVNYDLALTQSRTLRQKPDAPAPLTDTDALVYGVARYTGMTTQAFDALDNVSKSVLVKAYQERHEQHHSAQQHLLAAE